MDAPAQNRWHGSIDEKVQILRFSTSEPILLAEVLAHKDGIIIQHETTIMVQNRRIGVQLKAICYLAIGFGALLLIDVGLYWFFKA